MTRPSLPAADQPLVGRDREIGVLDAALAAASAGRGGLVLIGGEAGVGKTSLAEQCCAAAGARGATILVGRAYDLAETPPYGPWVDLFARHPAPPDLPPPAPFAQVGTVGTVASQSALVGALRDWLVALAARTPVALLLDDLHWADPASLDLLRALTRDLDTRPIVIVATYRADELTRRHPLYALLPVLEREARATRLDLRRLDRAGVAALVAARYALPAADAARLVAWLVARTEGNVFFTIQLLRALEDDGTLAPGPDGWTLGDPGRAGLPSALRQVLDARLARLGDEPLRLLTLAAVLGQEVPLDLWAAVAETDEDGLLDTLERAIEARLIAETPDGTAIRFAHALIREALYEGLLAARRRRVHRRAAETFLVTARPDPDAVAYHLQRAGDPRAAEWLIRAGERATRAYAWLTAAERYEAALALLDDDSDPARRALLLLTLAQLRRYSDAARSIPLAEEAARLAAASGDATLAAAARFDASHLRTFLGQRRTALAEMAAVWPTLERLNPDERGRLPAFIIQRVAPTEDYHRGVQVMVLTWVGDFAAAVALGSPFATRAPGTTARGLQGLGQAYAMLGRPAECWSAYDDARAAYLAAKQHREVGHVLLQEVDWAAHYRPDQSHELAQLADTYAQVWKLAGGVATIGSPLLARIPLLWLMGRWDEARAIERSPNWFHARPWLGLILRARGEKAAAWATVGEELPGGAATDLGDGAMFIQGLAMQRLAAALALDASDLPAARAWLTAHDRWLAECRAILGLAEGQLGWATYHRAKGDLTAARQHAERALAHATKPRQPLVLLAACRFLGEIDTTADRSTEAATHLDAALALADACEAPYERALTLLALAELRSAENRPDESQATLTEARAILEPLGAAPALARADALATRLTTTPVSQSVAAPPALPFGLTTREAEVLKLVAEGLPDAQIADRLFLSRFTVKAHLRSIYGKLGVPGRTAAARRATDHGLH